jgi:4-amino-4-deoxy-L-arabinose transferase-like glycosyltransferase
MNWSRAVHAWSVVWYSVIVYLGMALPCWYILALGAFAISSTFWMPDRQLGMVLWYGTTWIVFLFAAFAVSRWKHKYVSPFLMSLSFAGTALVVGLVEDVDQEFFVAYCVAVVLAIFFLSDRTVRRSSATMEMNSEKAIKGNGGSFRGAEKGGRYRK